MLHLTGPAPWLLAWLAGTAWQLFQPALWPFTVYGVMAACGVLSSMLWGWLARRTSLAWLDASVLWRFCAACGVAGTLAFALTGVRALMYQSEALDPALEGVDLQVTGVVSTGGALSVFKQHKQTLLWSSITDTHWLAQRLPLQHCAAGQAWEWDGVLFDFIHPLPADYDKPLSPNARSCVLRIRAQGQTVLLTADIEAMQEHALVQRMGDELKADVLLVPHHGSKTSSTENFLDAVQPRWALLQHGYRNRYGHPAPVVVQRYAVRGIRMLDSPHCGAMHWRSDQPGEVLCQRQLDKRYWRFKAGFAWCKLRMNHMVVLTVCLLMRTKIKLPTLRMVSQFS